ncbi:unnamed protein product [Paramecium pentaurelia]|uniref:Uncharacterized protein n=1 Tax=Paramecium pentaurelia TaxID=43138 RepID=A0A8S1VYV9_9CILI|nr:unnamed protein product [Paramecium pentaurelia]
MEMKQFIFTIIILGSQNFKRKTAIRAISNIQKYYFNQAYKENKPIKILMKFRQ